MEVKSRKGGKVSYLQRVREEDSRWKWKEAEGRKKMTILYSWREVTTVMGPVSTSPLHLSQWLLCQAWAVRQKSSSSSWSCMELQRVWQGFCLTAVSSDWQNRPAAGWSAAGVKWYRRFQHNMAVCSKTSQEIVSYWLLGGDAPGLLRCCLEYDELSL